MGFAAQSPCTGGGHTLSLGLSFPIYGLFFPRPAPLGLSHLRNRQLYSSSEPGGLAICPFLSPGHHHPTTTHILQMLSVICAHVDMKIESGVSLVPQMAPEMEPFTLLFCSRFFSLELFGDKVSISLDF